MNALREQTRVIVIDDDPTGSQTVHSCLLLTDWSVDAIEQALSDDAPLFFILANTRAMDAQQAAKTVREIARNITRALTNLKRQHKDVEPIIVSRSDSTLRGHYPLETDILAADLGPFDAHFLIPAFFEGGRITRDARHYLRTEDGEVAVDQTEFARDSVFGFSTSYLPDYVAEKTAGDIPANAVEHFSLNEVRGDCRDRLRGLTGNACCVVDAERQSDLDHFAGQLRQLVGEGKRFLFRSAASLLTALAQLPPQPVPPQAMGQYVKRGQPGLILVGSHVSKTTRQLHTLFENSDVVAIELEVEPLARIVSEQWRDRTPAIAASLLQRIEQAHRSGHTVVLFTSRQELHFTSAEARLAFGVRLSALLMDIVGALPPTLGFLISKGGITSNDVLSKGLTLRCARVLGQILPGCSVVRCPEDHPRFAGLPVVIFPGNVGDDESLLQAYRILQPGHAAFAKAQPQRA